jgi:MINDY deubiquitinase
MAAANALLLRGSIRLPRRAVKANACTLEELTTILVERAMGSYSDSQYVGDLLDNIPNFQFGMDVNPKFTQGCSGYEYTSALTAFDMLHVKLVHGWLADPSNEETYKALGNKTYNELVETILRGREAEAQMEATRKGLIEMRAQEKVARTKSSAVEDLQAKYQQLTDLQTQGHLIDEFINTTSHQLTQYGLQVLYDQLHEGELCVFFRNNHFNTLINQGGTLYLLVTDLGYKNAPEIVWEKLDVINGDTEYVNAHFMAPGSNPPPAVADSDVDRQVAMGVQMKRRLKINGPADLSGCETDVIAAATEESLRQYHGLEKLNEKPKASKNKNDDKSTFADDAKASMEESDAALAAELQKQAMEDLDEMIAHQIAKNMDHDDRMAYKIAEKLQDEENVKVWELRTTTRNPNTPGIPCVIQ